MFVNAWVKDYEILLDGKPYTAKGDRWFGVIDTENPDRYFIGAVFDYDENTGKYAYAGEVTRTETEFKQEVSDFVLVK